MIKVLFFARLREELSCHELQVAPADATDLISLRQYLLELHPEWQTFLANEHLLFAVNQTLVKNNPPITDGDEVAFFPPVTGG